MVLMGTLAPAFPSLLLSSSPSHGAPPNLLSPAALVKQVPEALGAS